MVTFVAAPGVAVTATSSPADGASPSLRAFKTAAPGVAGNVTLALPSAPVVTGAAPPLTVAPATGVRVPSPAFSAAARYSTTVTVTVDPATAVAGAPSRSSGSTDGGKSGGGPEWSASISTSSPSPSRSPQMPLPTL